KVTVIDNLPASLHLISAQGEGWSCSAATCERADVLAANATYPPLTVKVAVDANAPAALTNTAVLSGGGDLDATNNTGSDVAGGGAVVDTDFQVAKFVDKPLLRPGDTVVFRVEARNLA